MSDVMLITAPVLSRAGAPVSICQFQFVGRAVGSCGFPPLPSLERAILRYPPRAAKAGGKHLGQADAAIFLLAVFHHGDQRLSDGKAGAVQRVDEFRPPAGLAAEAGIHPAGLE